MVYIDMAEIVWERIVKNLLRKNKIDMEESRINHL